MTSPTQANTAPKLLAVIVDRDMGKRLEDCLREKHVYFQFVFHAMGTASSEVLKAFGLSGTEKSVYVCIEPAYRAKEHILAISERIEITRPGRGVAFIMPVSGVSAAISNVFTKQTDEQRERWVDHNMETEAEKIGSETRYELIAAIVNQGFSQDVMDIARHEGVRGGTILNARRSGLEDASKFLGISLQEEKEVVLILVAKSQKKELMQAIVTACGTQTPARGLVISLPVDACSGISLPEEA